MRDFGRFVILILFIPVILILSGPLLVLAVFRGRQPLGPITLDATRYNRWGRSGMLMLGLALWLLVWSGLVWLSLAAFTPPQLVVQVPVAVTPVEDPSPAALPSPPPQPTATPSPATPALLSEPASPTPPAASPTVRAALTATPLLADPLPTETLPPSPTATASPAATPTATATPTASASPTATPLFNEALATNTPSPEQDPAATGTPLASPTPAGPSTPFPTLTFSERRSALATVREANQLLRDTIAEASEQNIENLETIWQDMALTVVKRFAAEIYENYSQPLDVEFEYVNPPQLVEQVDANQLVITSTERWRYGNSPDSHEEAFAFIYTLARRDDSWQIVRYTYRNLPLPTPTTIVQTPTPAGP